MQGEPHVDDFLFGRKNLYQLGDNAARLTSAAYTRAIEPNSLTQQKKLYLFTTTSQH
jgi:hypothetical protein